MTPNHVKRRIRNVSAAKAARDAVKTDR